MITTLFVLESFLLPFENIINNNLNSGSGIFFLGTIYKTISALLFAKKSALNVKYIIFNI